ncbi:MAG: hypothetical protein CV087_16735 [Candidatus Brocadia sp. WS118]|nr:MAG: hypothetical protein CV087_16735 [Candidatus Brocadia sp. WS118]
MRFLITCLLSLILSIVATWIIITLVNIEVSIHVLFLAFALFYIIFYLFVFFLPDFNQIISLDEFVRSWKGILFLLIAISTVGLMIHFSPKKTNGAHNSTIFEPTPTKNIKGIVLDTESESPIDSATVILGNDTVFTDIDGNFSFLSVEVPYQDLLLIVNKEEFLEWSKTFERNQIDKEPLKVELISKKSTQKKKKENLKVEETVFTTIRGIVKNFRNNDPIGKASVIVEGDTTYTLSSGKFRLSSIEIPTTGLPIKVEKDGFFEVSDFFEIDQLSEELDIRLKPKLRILFADFVLEKENSSLEKYIREVPQMMKNAFVDCGEMEVLARGENLTQILEEIEYEKDMEGIFDPNEIVETGKMIGANYIVTGKISETTDGVRLQIDMNNMKKGTTELARNISIKTQEIIQYARFLSLEMVGKIVEIKITDLRFDPNDPRRVEIKGTNTCIPEGWHIWISVLPSGVENHYPQVKAEINGNEWVVPIVYLGADNGADAGRLFHIYAILTDPEANRIFSEYKENKVNSGIKLPRGARICDKVETKQGGKKT